MKKAAFASLTAVALCVSVPTYGQVSPIIGGGNAPCSKLLNASAFYNNQPNMQWLFGYISGSAAYDASIQMSRGQKSQFAARLDDMDWDTIIPMAQSYCQNNKSKKLYHAANYIISTINQ